MSLKCFVTQTDDKLPDVQRLQQQVKSLKGISQPMLKMRE